MIVRIVQTIQVDGVWFLEGTEYAYYGSFISETPDCEYDGVFYGDLSGTYHKVLIEDTFYSIPDVCATLLLGEVPSTDMRNRMQKLYAERTKDWTAPMFGDKTDVVKQAKKFLGLNIASRPANNIDVDQRKLALLEEAKQRLSTYKRPIGINEKDTGS